MGMLTLEESATFLHVRARLVSKQELRNPIEALTPGSPARTRVPYLHWLLQAQIHAAFGQGPVIQNSILGTLESRFLSKTEQFLCSDAAIVVRGLVC